MKHQSNQLLIVALSAIIVIAGILLTTQPKVFSQSDTDSEELETHGGEKTEGKVELRIVGVSKEGNGDIQITVKNMGRDTHFEYTENPNINLRKIDIKIAKNGNSLKEIKELNSECNWKTTKNAENLLKPGKTAVCDTGISWPSNTEDGKLEKFAVIENNTKDDEYTCDAGEEFC